MTRALITINYGDKLSPNSRASMQAAAARWGVDYFELCETTIPKLDGLHPAAMKTAVFKVLPYDDVFLLDADVIVSSLCPNPFEIFWHPEALRVVRDSSPIECRVQDWARHAQKMPDLLDIPLIAEDYWNSGMMLARREYHKNMFDLAYWLCHTDFGSPWVDQTILNQAAIIERVKIEFVDERWNYLHVQRAGADWQDMTKSGVFLNHGAGDPDRINWLHAVKWQ